MNKFNKEKHEYLIDGERATGITSIISVLSKPNLIPWAARMAVEYIEKILPSIKVGEANGGEYWTIDYESLIEHLKEAKVAHAKKKDKAAEHGTDTHELVEKYIKACIDEKHIIEIGDDHDVNLFFPIKKFTDWAVENVKQFLFFERQMYNKEMFIAGTADFACIMKDGKRLIGDFKTSSGVYGIDYFLQCAGYKILAESEGDEPYDGCVIARLGKDNSFEVYISYDSKVEEEAFRACLTIYRAQATFKKFETIKNK